MHFFKITYCLIAGLMMAGCETARPIHVERYVSNPSTLQALLKSPATSVSVGKIENGVGIETTLDCLNEGIPFPDLATAGDYIRSGLIAELSNADQFEVNATNSIAGSVVVAELTFERKIMLAAHGGTWNFEVNLTSTNGQSMTVKSSHSYHTGYAPIRCNIAADYLMPAIQTLIYDIVRTPDFQKLF
ncbi:hypothetical protein [Pseudohongiella sp.]|uniref:Lipoprotein n=1 Tax=marine sediment metagenome TaxID=412755 RepID=A0A0F9W2T6_9ZZZZ|nr:hypothetical protein [Pseudohongiella sp.]HDZ09191.1 hypothetical protein [Pseudohongiella sp.]